MPTSGEICLRTTRSSIVKPVRSSSARRPSSAIPRLSEIKVCQDDEIHKPSIEIPSVLLSSQTMDVYLRLKPRLTKSKRLKKLKDNSYIVLNDSTLVTKFTSLEGTKNPSNRSKSPEITSRKFDFTKIFDSNISQADFFEQSIKERILDFLAGKSCTFMSYGTTNSGKTYTFHGNSESLGIIPRTIEFIFSGVNCTLLPWYKPRNLNEVLSLDESGRTHETELREKLFASRSIDKSMSDEIFGGLKNSMKEEREIGESGESMYSVWFSFVEIYNENIYDLLAEEESTKLTSLKLVKDKQGRAFIQGLRMLSATTGIDAYRILMAGQSRLTIGPNSSNPQSSKSHSIFTIKLLKYVKDSTPQDVEMSTIRFCDLAGTGRTRKSFVGSGNELKESRNINTSLLVLGRCLKGTLECQTSKQSSEIIGPFRESKLTRLFERVLIGKENLAMIVNLDTSIDLHVETLSVLNFSAIAKKIFFESPDKEGNKLRVVSGTKIREAVENKRPSSCRIERDSDLLESTNKSEIEKLKEANESLVRENNNLRENTSNREHEIRTEMSNLYGGMIKELEDNWRKRNNDVQDENDDFLKWSVKQIETFYKERIDDLSISKRRRTSGGDQKDDGKTLFEELETKNTSLTGEILVMRKMIKKFKDEQDILSADKNKCVFELGLVKHELRQVRNLINDERGENFAINDDNNVIDDLKALIDEKNERLKNLQNKISSQSTNFANSIHLDSITTEELNQEICKRNKNIFVTRQNEIFLEDSKMIKLPGNVDAKFSTSTFNKESLLTVSMEKKLIKNENLFSKHETNESINDRKNDSFETAEKIIEDNCNDSGINDSSQRTLWSTENSLECKTEEKGSQTSFKNDKKIEFGSERVDQLKLDYTRLTAELFQDTIRVDEFSEKLKSIQLEVSELKEKTCINEKIIFQYRDQLALREKNLTNLGEIKSEMESKLCEISRQLESNSIIYEDKIIELREKLAISEDTENRKTKSIDEYLEKLAFLENQLSITHKQLDETSLKCIAEHLPRIEKLQNDLSEKTIKVNKLDEKLSKCQRNMEKLSELNDKVTIFGKIFEKYENERDQIKKELAEKIETQSVLECKIKRIINKVRDRENEISTLTTDLSNIVKMNMENSEKARELSKDISFAMDRLSNAEIEIKRSEDERRKIERTSAHEIGNLKARLIDFEKNSTRIRDNEDARKNELDRLKLLMHDKEREMCLFKKNRDKTIRRYEALIRKLQADIEMQCNRESSKLRMLYPKKLKSKESLKSLSESYHWKATLVESIKKKRNSHNNSSALTRNNSQCQSFDRSKKYRCHQSFPVCTGQSMVKRSSSQALVTSSTSFEGSSSSQIFPIRDHDEENPVDHEIIETESCTQLNLDIVERLDYQRRNNLSQAVGTFSVPSTSDDSLTDFRNMPVWSEIRRTNGRTHFRFQKEDSDIDSEDKDRC